MSTIDEVEKSVSDSQPVELYKFEGSYANYFYTSSTQVITFDGDHYVPVAVSRNNVKVTTQEDDSLTIDLTLPFDVDVVLDYAYANSPPKLHLTVYRLQAMTTSGPEWRQFWQGDIRGFNINGREATIQVPSIFSQALQSDVPNVYYQTPCNHVLYNERCTILREDHQFAGVVDGVSGTTVKLRASPSATVNDFAAGDMVCLRTGERRTVKGSSGTTIIAAYPFMDLAPGDDVHIFRGCARTLAVCKAKFNNVVNFGGHPYIPDSNPFEGSL